MDSQEKQEPFGIDLTGSVRLKRSLLKRHGCCRALTSFHGFAGQGGMCDYDKDEP
jgi:hypothetical protein